MLADDPMPPTALSPSPVPGQPLPDRRAEDTKSYSGEWTVLVIALGTWAVSFFNEISDKTWADIQTLHFVAEHAAQVMGVVVSVVAAKRIK